MDEPVGFVHFLLYVIQLKSEITECIFSIGGYLKYE